MCGHEVKNRHVQFGNLKSLRKGCNSMCTFITSIGNGWELFVVIYKLLNIQMKSVFKIYDESKSTTSVPVFKHLCNSIPDIFEDPA